MHRHSFSRAQLCSVRIPRKIQELGAAFSTAVLVCLASIALLADVDWLWMEVLRVAHGSFTWRDVVVILFPISDLV